LKKLEASFTIIVDDPSGNSFVENPNAPRKDEQITILHYKRTKEQAEALGFQVSDWFIVGTFFCIRLLSVGHH
jgi:zinc finger protein